MFNSVVFIIITIFNKSTTFITKIYHPSAPIVMNLVDPNIDNSQVVSKSWDGICVTNCQFSGPVHLRHIQSTGHRFIFNNGEPLPVSWKDPTGWKSKVYSPGSLSIMPYGEYNEVTWNKNAKAVIVNLEPQFAEKFFERGPIQLTQQRGVTDQDAYQLAQALNHELKYREVACFGLADALKATFTAHLVTRYSVPGKRIIWAQGKLSARQLKNVIDYCVETIGTQVNLDELAAIANLSQFHFIRQFRNTIGLTPHQFLLKLKIEKAVQMLQTRENTINEIAYLLGFTDQAHFSNAFKKIMGYRPKHQKQKLSNFLQNVV